eukprot:8603686-Karenia_brevis.AAC.1
MDCVSRQGKENRDGHGHYSATQWRERDGDILMKSDTEESMKLLARSRQEERREGKTVVEEAAKKVKGSNGVVERAVQEIEGRTRSILLSLEERM